MHSADTLVFDNLFILLFLGTLAIVYLGLLIYSVVVKRYWITGILLVLPLGLILLIVAAFFLLSPRKIEIHKTDLAHESQIYPQSQQGGFVEIKSEDSTHSPGIVHRNSHDIGHAEATDSHPTNYEYSPSKLPNADIYPSLALCGRPLAFQLANAIRNSHQFSPKTVFSFEIIKGKQSNKNISNDDTQWQPTDSFRNAFAAEFLKQFPQSKFQEANAEATNQDFEKMDIQLSHSTSKADQPSGSVQANWIVNDKTKGKASVNYIEKRWVNSITSLARAPGSFGGTYQPNHSTEYDIQVIGFTNRFARSAQEASSLAMQNAKDFYMHPNSSYSFTVIDRFTQKITMPYGDLWQEAVLIAVNPEQIGKVTRSSEPFMNLAPNTSLMNQSPRGLLLLILALGAFGVAWTSNVFTQGYYRQTIRYTLVTALAVIAGLMILAMLIRFTH